MLLYQAWLNLNWEFGGQRNLAGPGGHLCSFAPVLSSASSMASRGKKSQKSQAGNKIQVCVRLRPMNEREEEKETTPVVQASSVQNTITVVRGKGKTALRHGVYYY